jgi:plastocyanin
MKVFGLFSVVGAVCAALVVVVGGTAAPGPCQPGDVLVEIRNSTFSPSSAAVAPGGTVCWTNRDAFQHTVTSPGAFDSGFLNQNESFRQTFPTAGTFLYACSVPTHTMSGQVVVSAGAPPPPPPAPPPPPPAPAALSVTGVKFAVQRRAGGRTLVARARVNRRAAARLSLLKGRRTVSSSRKSWRAGANTISTPVRRSNARGRWTAVLQVGTRRISRTVRIG